MSSINPDSSRPRTPRARRPEEALGAPSGQLEGRSGRESRSSSEERGYGPEAGFPRDEFRRGHRPEGHGPHGHHRPPHGPREGAGMNRPVPPDPATMVERLIAKADANGDGMLTRDELQTFFQARQSERMAPLDPATVTPPATSADPTTPDVGDLLTAGLLDTEGTLDQTSADLVSDPASEAVAADPTEQQASGTVATDPTTEATTPDPATLQQQVLGWLASIQQDPQYASLSADQQQQIQAASDAVKALDPADPTFLESLQTLLQASGLAE
ncbi:MAG TPA: hypothetical protein V6D05_16660 [Stenomitos sp.]